MDKDKLTNFLIKARAKTYAGNSGGVTQLLPGSKQLEYKEGEWLYRDVYNQGNKIFAGLETVYFKGAPVWSMSYYGNFKEMTEKEADKVLRGALIAKKDTARLWHDVEWENEGYTYTCSGYGSIDELGGEEEISKDGQKLFFLFYAGGFTG